MAKLENCGVVQAIFKRKAMLSRLLPFVFAAMVPVVASAQPLDPGDVSGTSSGGTTRAAKILLYVGAGTVQIDGAIATSVHCFNQSNSAADVRLRFRNNSNVTIWDNTNSVAAKHTRTWSTSATFYGETIGPGGSDLQQGSVMIFSTTDKLVCSAELVDTTDNPVRSPMPQTHKIRMMRYSTPDGASQ